MLPKVNPASTTAWQDLQAHYSQLQTAHLRQLFADEPDRFQKFSLCSDDVVFDYSKNIINSETIDLLVQLAN